MPDTFDQFWQAWPKARRLAKQEALAVWKKLTDPERVKALAAVKVQTWVWKQDKTEPAYMLHPSRWLKRKRFNDDTLRAACFKMNKPKQAAVARSQGSAEFRRRYEREGHTIWKGIDDD